MEETWEFGDEAYLVGLGQDEDEQRVMVYGKCPRIGYVRVLLEEGKKIAGHSTPAPKNWGQAPMRFLGRHYVDVHPQNLRQITPAIPIHEVDFSTLSRQPALEAA
jgi:hypothetical protein